MFGRGVLSRQVDRRLERAHPGWWRPRGVGDLQTVPAAWQVAVPDRQPTLSWAENVVVSWTGMRGVVTLAILIPTTAAGNRSPERATIQAIAFVVSVGTLLLQGGHCRC